MAAGRGLHEFASPLAGDDGGEALSDVESSRAVKWEAALLLGDPATVPSVRPAIGIHQCGASNSSRGGTQTDGTNGIWRSERWRKLARPTTQERVLTWAYATAPYRMVSPGRQALDGQRLTNEGSPEDATLKPEDVATHDPTTQRRPIRLQSSRNRGRVVGCEPYEVGDPTRSRHRHARFGADPASGRVATWRVQGPPTWAREALHSRVRSSTSTSVGSSLTAWWGRPILSVAGSAAVGPMSCDSPSSALWPTSRKRKVAPRTGRGSPRWPTSELRW